MKNKLFLFSFLVLTTLGACATDENTNEISDPPVLPKTISYKYPDFPEQNANITLAYDGNKIVNSTKKDSRTVFTYDGNVIVKQVKYFLQNGKETKFTEVYYSYENGKLKTRTIRESFSQNYPEGQYIYKTVYTHTSDALITYINYSVNADTKIETKDTNGNLTYSNGNLTKEEQFSGTSKSERVYEYDSKNNPYKNILGFDLLLNEIDNYAKNNRTKTIRSEVGLPVANYLTNYTYNEDGYPSKSTSFTSDGKTIEYEIEFTY